uniref:Uncharacterized protein n=1 Tax=Opuntia streptacantha TaxID=393608 RepID=A0A7C9D206_OPUST
MPPCSASQTYFPTSNLHGYGTKSPTFYGQYTLFSSPSRLRPAFALYRPAGLHPPPFFQSICLKLSSTGRRFTLHQRQICLKLDLLLQKLKMGLIRYVFLPKLKLCYVWQFSGSSSNFVRPISGSIMF